MFLNKSASFIVDYFFHTAIAASLLYINSQLLRGFRIDFAYATLLFFATLSIYNFSNLNSSKTSNRKTIVAFSTVLIIYFCIKNVESIADIKFKIVLLLFLVCGYIFPLKKLHLRNIGVLKIFLLSLAWSLAAVMVNDLSNRITMTTFVINFLFVFSISLPFDMRDIEVDKINTIPKKIGEKKSVFLSILLYVIAMIFTYSLTQSLIIALLMLAFGVPYLWMAKKYFTYKFYLAGLELLIVLHTALLVYFFR